MNDKQEFDASDVVWGNIKNVEIKHFVIYEDVILPQRFQRLNPFAWINYWRKRRSNLIAYGWLNDEEDT